MRHFVVGPALALCLCASTARAQPAPEPLAWQEHHSRAGWGHAVGTGLVLSMGLLGFFTLRPQRPRWTDRNDLDDGVRDAFVLGTYEERETVAEITDIAMISLIAFPIVVDAVLAAGLIRGSEDVALQTAIISAEVTSLALLSEVLTWQAARERPFVRECAADPQYASGCAEIGRGGPSPTGFAGGHALLSFASAGVTCAHHTNLPIYGHAGADAAACVSALAVAAGVAIGRLPADRHYLTDTIAGSALGLGVGWLLPVLLHYHPWASAPASVTVLPGAPGAQGGLSLRGVL